MLAKLRLRLTYANVVSTICLCLVVGGGSAYAANTIGSSDVINESLLSEDVKNGEVKTSELADAAVTRNKLVSGAVTNGKLGGSAVDGSKVADNSLGGADILESSLAQVPNADKLDGIDSTGFIQGGGSADGQAIAQGPGQNAFLGLAFGGFVRLQYLCPSPVGGNGTLTIHNASTGVANFFVDSGGANPDYFQLASGGFTSYPAAAGGESFSIQAQGGPGVLTLEVATVHRNSANDCHAQAQGLLAQ